MNDDTFNAEEPKKKSKMGCILGGCLGVFVLGLIGFGLTAFFGWRFIAGQVEKYTSDTPRELPIVEYSDEQMQALQDQLDQIENSAANGEVAGQMILTADDINALIAEQDELRGRVSVKIENGQFIADVSVPTDMIPGGKGRYFNGSATADATLNNGRLDVSVVDATVNGEAVPADFITGIRNENLAKEFNNNPETSKILQRFERGEIEGDKVILTPKGSAGMLESSDASLELEPISP